MLRSWWRRWNPRTNPFTPPRVRRPRRFRPEVTGLEERCLMSVQVLPPLTGTPPTPGFQGLTQSETQNGIEPPDTVAAAGPAHVVELTNGTVQSTTGTVGLA